MASGLRKARRDMNMPPPGVIRDFRSYLDQTLLLLSLHERVIGPRKRIFERRQPGFIPMRGQRSDLGSSRPWRVSVAKSGQPFVVDEICRGRQ